MSTSSTEQRCDIRHPHAGPCRTERLGSVDPRITRTRLGVMAAAEELLLEGGPAAVTIEAITNRSGIAKTTIYRHWPTHNELMFDVLLRVAPQIDAPPESADATAALRALCRQIVVATAGERWQRVLPAMLLMKLRNELIADLEEQLYQHMSASVGTTLQRLIGNGAIVLPESLGTTAEERLQHALHLLVGPIVMARLMGRFDIDEQFADATADQFQRAYARPTSSPEG